MLTLTYLQNHLTNIIPGINDTSEQVIESAAGYDGIIELIQNKDLPLVVVLEHNEVGSFSFRPGGFHTTSQSIWLMEMVAADEDRRSIQQNCFNSVRHLLTALKTVKEDLPDGSMDELAGWDWLDIPYGVRNAGSNFTGYEVTLYFRENTDLSGLREEESTETEDNEEENGNG